MTMETFGENFSAEACSGKEIAGLLKKMMMIMMMNMMTRKSLLVCSEGLARLSRRVWRRFVRGSREISLVPSLHRASTDALINH